jgi:subtilisin family serine protease
VTVVVAAGNDGSDSATQIPAAYREVISVSAIVDTDGKAGGAGLPTFYGADDNFALFSNFGKSVSVAAPGVNIYSTFKNGGYATLSGTSMAAPHVTGAAALYLFDHPAAGPAEVKAALTATGEPLGKGHNDPFRLHPEPVVSTATF